MIRTTKSIVSCLTLVFVCICMSFQCSINGGSKKNVLTALSEAATSDLQSDLADYTQAWQDNSDFLKLVWIKNSLQAVTRVDGMSDPTFDGNSIAYEGLDLCGAFEITNSYLAADSIQIEGGAYKTLQEIPTMFSCDVETLALPSEDWHGVGVNFGMDKSGYSWNVRFQKNGDMHLLGKMPTTEKAINGKNTGVKPNVRQKNNITVIKDVQKIKVYLDGTKIIDSVFEGENELIKTKFGFYTTYAGMKLSNIKAIALVKIQSPKIEAGKINTNAVTANAQIISKAGTKVTRTGDDFNVEKCNDSFEIKGEGSDGQVYLRQSNSSWKMTKVDQRTLSTITQFKFKANDIDLDASFTYTFRSNGSKYMNVKFTSTSITVNSDSNEIYKNETIINLEEEISVVILSTPTSVTVWKNDVPVILECTVNVENLNNFYGFTVNNCAIKIAGLDVKYVEPVAFKLDPENIYPVQPPKPPVNDVLVSFNINTGCGKASVAFIAILSLVLLAMRIKR